MYKYFIWNLIVPFLYMYKSFILNRIVPLTIHSPSPHKFYSVGLLSGSWDNQSLKELLLENQKNSSLCKESYLRYKSIEHELKMLDKAISLDDKLSDKTKNGEMNKIISYYETYFDEDSGNTREEGIKQVHGYLKEEAKSHLNNHKNIKMKIDNIQKEIDKRKAVEGNKKAEEEIKKAVENNQNTFSILPLISINSFTILRILLSIFSWFIYFKLIDFNLYYLIPNMPDVTIPMIFTSIVLFVWEYYKLYSKVRKYYKLGKIIYMFCEEKLSLIIRIANNSPGIINRFFNFIASNPLLIVRYPLVVYSFVVLICIGLVYYCSDFSPYGYNSCHIGCDAPMAWELYSRDSPSPQVVTLVELHDNILYYLVSILFAWGWIQAAIIRNIQSYRFPISNKYLNRNRLTGILCTVIAALLIVYILTSHIHVICYVFVLILAIIY